MIDSSLIRVHQHGANGSKKGIRLHGSLAREANANLVKHIGEIADSKGAKPAQVALAWLLAQQPWIVPIPGTTKKHRMEENAGGADVDLTAADLTLLSELLAKMPVTGDRYTPAMQAAIDR